MPAKLSSFFKTLRVHHMVHAVPLAAEHLVPCAPHSHDESRAVVTTLEHEALVGASVLQNVNMACVFDLPGELLHAIALMLNDRTLKGLCLTAKAFLPHCQRVLFQKVSLDVRGPALFKDKHNKEKRRMKGLFDIFVNSPHLLHYIKDLSLSYGHSYSALGPLSNQLEFILHHVDTLQSLRLQFRGQTLIQATLPGLHIFFSEWFPTLPVRKLHLFNTHLPIELLFSLKRLQELHVETSSLAYNEFQMLLPTALRLSFLSIQDSNRSSPGLFTLIPQDTMIDFELLQHLEISGVFGVIEHWNSALPNFTRLRSLKLFAKCEWHDPYEEDIHPFYPTPLFNLSKLGNLRYLTICMDLYPTSFVQHNDRAAEANHGWVSGVLQTASNLPKLEEINFVMYFEWTLMVARWHLAWSDWEDLFLDQMRWPLLRRLNLLWRVEDSRDDCDDSRLFLSHVFARLLKKPFLQVISSVRPAFEPRPF